MSARRVRCFAIAVVVAFCVTSGAPAVAAGSGGESPFRAGYSDDWFGQQIVQLWSYDAGSAVFSPPVTDGTAVYAGSDAGRFFAIDPASGAELWRYDAGSAIKDSACIAGDCVYFTTLKGNVVALDAATGARIWQVPLGERLDAGVAVMDDRVIVPCSDGYVRALSTTDGSLIWKYQVGLGVRLLSTPAPAGSVALIESDGKLTALDPLTGTAAWSLATGGEHRYWPAVSGGRAVTAGSGDADGGLTLFNTATGGVIRRYTYSGDNHWAAAAIDPGDGTIYAGLEGGVFSFDAQLTRRSLWNDRTQATAGGKRYVMWQPLILRDLVVVPGHLEISTADALFFFSRDGQLSFLGKTPLPEKLAASPLVYQSVLYYGSVSGHLLALAPVRVTVNGALVDFGQKQPLAQPSGRVIVPARAVVEAAGGTVAWDPVGRVVTARLGSHTVVMTIDSSTVLVDSLPVTIDEPARLINDSTLLPIRSVMEGLGGRVVWDQTARTVVITTAPD